MHSFLHILFENPPKNQAPIFLSHPPKKENPFFRQLIKNSLWKLNWFEKNNLEWKKWTGLKKMNWFEKILTRGKN